MMGSDSAKSNHNSKQSVNKAVSEARSEAHPGDIRRMMGNDAGKSKPHSKQLVNKTTKVSHLSWVDQACKDYWNGDYQDF